MPEETEFVELLQLQGDLKLVSKSELIEWARDHGLAVTLRRLTTMMTEGLLPKTARIGARGGAYPDIVKRQLGFVMDLREKGVPVSVIKELLPVWRFMLGARREGVVDIGELESTAVASVQSEAAAMLVPVVIQQELPCPGCRPDELSELKFRYKDDTMHSRGANDDVSMGVLLEEVDGDGECRTMYFARLTLPRTDEENDPSTIVFKFSKSHSNGSSQSAPAIARVVKVEEGAVA